MFLLCSFNGSLSITRELLSPNHPAVCQLLPSIRKNTIQEMTHYLNCNSFHRFNKLVNDIITSLNAAAFLDNSY